LSTQSAQTAAHEAQVNLLSKTNALFAITHP